MALRYAKIGSVDKVSNGIGDCMNEKFAIPGVAGIIEKEMDGILHVLIQERWKEDAKAEEGLIEIPAGKIREFENIYDCLRREIKEETGLNVIEIEGEEEAVIFELNDYKVLNYRPFAHAQNIQGSYPIMVQTFICEVNGELVKKTNETQNLRWISIEALKHMVQNETESLYPMHVHTFMQYFEHRGY